MPKSSLKPNNKIRKIKDEYNTHSRYRDLRNLRNDGDKIRRSKNAPSVEKKEIKDNGQNSNIRKKGMQRFI